MPCVTYDIPSNRAVKWSLECHKVLNCAHLALAPSIWRVFDVGLCFKFTAKFLSSNTRKVVFNCCGYFYPSGCCHSHSRRLAIGAGSGVLIFTSTDLWNIWRFYSWRKERRHSHRSHRQILDRNHRQSYLVLLVILFHQIDKFVLVGRR